MVKIGGYVPPSKRKGGLDTISGIGNNQAYNQQHMSMYSVAHCRVYAVSFGDLFGEHVRFIEDNDRLDFG